MASLSFFIFITYRTTRDLCFTYSSLYFLSAAPMPISGQRCWRTVSMYLSVQEILCGADAGVSFIIP